LFLDDGNLDASDLVTTPFSGQTINLAVGDYVVAVGARILYISEAVSGINFNSTPGSYNIFIDTSYGTWKTTDSNFGWGIDGLTVSLDATNIASPLYTIISNTDETFVVETIDDLTTVVGNELIGVYEFETLNVTNGAAVSFGTDRVIVNNLPGSIIDATSSVTAAPDSVLP